MRVASKQLNDYFIYFLDKRFENPAPTVRVAVEGWNPHVDLVMSDDNKIANVTGPMADLLFLLAKTLNFRYGLFFSLFCDAKQFLFLCDRYEFVRPKDFAWGVLKEDGTWSGMIGQLMNDVL